MLNTTTNGLLEDFSKFRKLEKLERGARMFYLAFSFLVEIKTKIAMYS